MANYAKYTRGAMGHMLKHYERAKDADGQYLKFGNQDIDTKRTEQNYNLAPQHNQLDFIHERLSEVYCMNRKDVNVMCSWVVTAPEDLKPEQEKEFFQESYRFLEAKYGRENVVSSYVHKDEVTPHMHFCFMPVVSDRKRGGFKISAKECVKRTDLEQFHEKLQCHLEEKGISCSIINEATKEGNKAIKELKRGTARQTLQEVRKATKAEQAVLKKLQAEKQALNRDVEALKGLKNITGKVLQNQEVKAIKTESVMFDDTKVKLNKTDFENLRKTAIAGETANKTYEAAKGYLQKAEKTLEVVEQKRKEPIPERMERLKLQKKVEDYDAALERCEPPVKQAFRKALKAVTEPQKQKGHKITHER
ncbi:MobV family relaxase [uncultured Alistipes sp.]|jgi:hypothetical protein|uniref:MobV family relaxase n=1 Tax=uncultured Alistipes sp. TaxID=538949 RepID=UPI00321FD59F